MFICIAFGQLVVFWFFALTRSSACELFTNFCTIANCSILMLEYNNYGYYVHGQAPWRESDLPLSWLKKELENEHLGSLASRNFAKNNERIPKSDTSQVITTYEIYLSKQFRREYYEKKHGKFVVPSNPNEGSPGV